MSNIRKGISTGSRFINPVRSVSGRAGRITAAPLASGATGAASGANSTFSAPHSFVSKGTQNIRNLIPAGTTITLPVNGNFFYFPALSDTVSVAPIGQYGRDTSNPYYPGTGLIVELENAFSALELKNNTSNSLMFELVAGFDGYIDNRLTYPSIQFKQILRSIYAGYTAPASSVTITDLSGTIFTDDNGNQWYAVNRQLLLGFNADSSDYWFLQNTAASIYQALAQPLTSFQVPVSGNFKLKQGTSGASVNGIVSEIYNCLAKLI